ncbi:MAG: MFS transporter [Rhodobacteraceae bacterium]|nr:MFS transporter [Paracoccaceae bacterium]
MTNSRTEAGGTGAQPGLTDWTVVWAATLAGIAVALQMGKAAATLPLMRAEFGASIGLLANYVALISVVAALFGILFGSVTHYLGARRAGLIGLALVTLGSAVGAETSGISVLMTSRLIEAVGFALTITAMPAIIQPATRASDRSLAMGLWAIWLPTGFAVMMAISYFLLDSIGWRGMFRLCAMLPALAALFLLGATRTQTIARRQPAQATFRAVFRREVLLIFGIFIGFAAANLVITAFLPTILADQYGMPASRAAAVSFVGAVSLGLAAVLTGWLVQKGLCLRPLFLASLAGMILCAGIVLLAGADLWVSIAAAIGFSMLAGIPPSLVWLSIPILVRSPSEVPVLSGLLFQGAGIGQLLGPVLAGWVVEASGSWAMAFWVVAIPCLAAIALTAMLSPTLSGRHDG